MMMQKRFAVLGALVCALSLLNGVRTEAAYNYSTSLSITSATNGATPTNLTTGASATLGGTTITLGNVARTNFNVPSTNTLNIGDVAVTSSVAPPGNSFTINYTDVITLTNIGPPEAGTPGTSTVTLTGTITLTGISTGTGQVANSYIITTGTTTAGGVPFTVNGSNFGNPTVNGPGGSLGGQIVAGAVPEPASIVTLGLGVGALGFVGLRRRFRSA